MRVIWVRGVWVLVLLAILGFGGWAALRLQDRAPQEAMAVLPAIELSNLDGIPVALARKAEGRLAILFVSVDCDHCRQQILALNRAPETVTEPRFRAVELVAVTLEDARQARDFQQRLNIDIPLLAQGRALAGALGLRGVPALVLVDAEGAVVYHHQGRRSSRFVALLLDRFARGKGLSESELWAAYNAPTAASPVDGGRDES